MASSTDASDFTTDTDSPPIAPLQSSWIVNASGLTGTDTTPHIETATDKDKSPDTEPSDQEHRRKEKEKKKKRRQRERRKVEKEFEAFALLCAEDPDAALEQFVGFSNLRSEYKELR